MDKAEALTELTRLRRQWFAKRKGVMALLRETLFQQESPLIDSDAANKSADADAALQELGADLVAFGYMTVTITVTDTDARRADEMQRLVERTIRGTRTGHHCRAVERGRGLAIVQFPVTLTQTCDSHLSPRSTWRT